MTLDYFEDAVKGQLIEDTMSALKWLGEEYPDVTVPSDEETAVELVEAMADPSMIYTFDDHPTEHERFEELIEDSTILRLSLARSGMMTYFQSLNAPLQPPDSGGGHPPTIGRN